MDNGDPNRLDPLQPNLLNPYSNGEMGIAGLLQSRRQGVGYIFVIGYGAVWWTLFLTVANSPVRTGSYKMLEGSALD